MADGRKKNGSVEGVARAREVLAQRRSSDVAVELQVRDHEHARSEEVLQYCLSELERGTTYNDLRLKLGLGPASIDRRWREIREILVELILPESEEEALRVDAGLSGFMIGRIESFMKKVEQRAASMAGEDSEAALLKLELDAMKLLMDKYSKRTDHFLKMKDIKSKEKRTTGTTIIFNNLHAVRRPGDNEPLADAAKLVTQKRKIESEAD